MNEMELRLECLKLANSAKIAFNQYQPDPIATARMANYYFSYVIEGISGETNPKDITVIIDFDGSAFTAAMQELSLFEAVFERLYGFLDIENAFHKLFRIDSYPRPACANHMIIACKPSDLLLDLLVACRAGNSYEALLNIVSDNHNDLPSDVNVHPRQGTPAS